MAQTSLCAAYYRGAMGILLVYDVCDESSFNNIRIWVKNIEAHASDGVNRILIGNKCDMTDKKVFLILLHLLFLHAAQRFQAPWMKRRTAPSSQHDSNTLAVHLLFLTL